MSYVFIGIQYIMPQSIETNIADLANGWLKSYDLRHKIEQESLNDEIDKALKKYQSKAGDERCDAFDRRKINTTNECWVRRKKGRV
jgi:hypothetical protein